MEHNKNPESWDDDDEPFFADDEDDWASTPAGLRGEPSPHLKPGEKSWAELEQDRRREGLPPRHSLPGEPPLPHEIPPTREPKRTGTGFFYKNGDEIPPTHPDHGPMHRVPRQEDGSYSAYYYCSKQELADVDVPAPPPRRHRRDGFTPERIETFIATLRATASVSDAARAADISRKTAYDLYARADAGAFRAAWDEALRGPSIVLASTAYDRAVNGVEEIVYYQGRRVGVRIKYDNRLLMFLLRVRDPLNFAPLDDLQGWLRHRDVEPHVPIEPALDRLALAEHEWGRRLPGEGGDPPALAAPRPALAAPPALDSAPLSGAGEDAPGLPPPRV